MLRKFGTNKKNPNPAWPNQGSMVVLPPGSNAAVGMNRENVYEMTAEEMRQNNVSSVNTQNSVNNEESEREIRQDPIMGSVQSRVIPRRNMMSGLQSGNMCGYTGVAGYLCGQIGKYVKMEFLFGENTHMEKMGRLKEVGKDFVAIEENGSGSITVCSINKIKFINIYQYGF